MVREGLRMRHGNQLSWAQVVMAANTPMLLRAGLVDGNAEAGVLASGQVVGMISDLPSCADVITGVVTQATEILRGLTYFATSSAS
jgi:NAD(P)H-dependent flavin oxidoreductase YrpB (nitropropane dioxygenase family)